MPKNRRGGQRAGGQRTGGSGDVVAQTLGPQGTPETMAEAAANTNYNYLAASNDPDRRTRGSWAWSWTHNCQRCAWAVEARMRGYDVEAMPRTLDDDYAKSDETLPKSFVNVSTTPVQLESCGPFWRDHSATDVKDAILTNNPEGARGMLVGNRTSGGGHVVNWQIKNGKVVLYDGQTGQKTSVSHLKKTGIAWFRWGRMDDKQFSPLIADYVKQHGS